MTIEIFFIFLGVGVGGGGKMRNIMAISAYIFKASNQS